MAKRRTKSRKSSKENIDRTNYYRLLGIVCVMVLFGIIMILSASSIRAFASTGDSYYYLKRQALWVGLGLLAMLICSQISMRNLQKLAPQAVYIVMGLLVAVLIPGIGKEVDGSSRWIPLGSFQLQPSELAKFAVILYTADYISKLKGGLRDIKDLVYPYGMVVGAVVLLVMMQPDLGTTLAICMATFAMIYVGGLRHTQVLGLAATGLIVGALSIYTREYQLRRFAAFLDPNSDPLGAGYHIRQSLLAFGSGGIFGIGLGVSRQKYFYLPAAHTDFIFAIIGEELGLLGTLFTVLLFVLFAYYGIRISFQSKNTFARLTGAGLTSLICLQALVNMGAVTAVLPITGIPMPFISYGGSSLLANLAGVGVLLGIALDNERAAARGKRPELYVIENGEAERPKNPKKKGSATKRKANSSRTLENDSATSTRKRTAKKKTRSTKSDASGDKRRRDSRTRVSRSSTSQRATKSKKRS